MLLEMYSMLNFEFSLFYVNVNKIVLHCLLGLEQNTDESPIQKYQA